MDSPRLICPGGYVALANLNVIHGSVADSFHVIGRGTRPINGTRDSCMHAQVLLELLHVLVTYICM